MIEHEYSAIQANLSYYCSVPAALGYFCGILMVAHITLSGMPLENAIQWGPPRPNPGRWDVEKDSNGYTEEVADPSITLSNPNVVTDLASVNQEPVSLESVEELDKANKDNNKSIYPNRSALFKTSTGASNQGVSAQSEQGRDLVI